MDDYLNGLVFNIPGFDDGLDNAMIDDDPDHWLVDETTPMHSVDTGENPTPGLKDGISEGSKNGRYVPYTMRWAYTRTVLAARTGMDQR